MEMVRDLYWELGKNAIELMMKYKKCRFGLDK